MKIIPLKNEFNETLAVQVVDYNFARGDIRATIELIKEYGVVVWKRTNLSIKEYYHWQLKLGYHQHANMWCSHQKYPIFFRVTNKPIDQRGPGLFADQELDWHCNVLFTPDAEELLGLYAQTIPAGSKTFFANSLPYRKSLDTQLVQQLANFRVEVTDQIDKTYEKTLVHYHLPTYQAQDFVKQRKALDIKKSVNFEKEYNRHYPLPRFGKRHLLRLFPKHPLGIEGIYFPHYHIASIVDSKGAIVPDHREIYQKIKEEYILSGRFVYGHQWEEGDLVLSDQLTGVHRRNDVWQNNPLAQRELLRSACWYKTAYRQHFERSV